MADPLSITASLLAVVTVAVQSTKALRETIIRFKDRDKTLARLQNEVQDLVTILDSLRQVIDTEVSMLALLQGPIERCAQVCREFEQSMESFGRKSKTGFRDWTKMEFMRGDINEFIDTISGYKSTISVGLGTVTIHTAKVSRKVLQDYNEMIQDTSYNLEVQLRRVDEKMARFTTDNASILNTSVDLKDEREVTKQCLRICEDASHYIESLTNQESSILHKTLQDATEDSGQNYFEAQTITRQALDENRDSFAMIIGQLRRRLESLILKNDPSDENERSRLLSDIDTSKQCLEVCKVASEVSTQKIYRIGEVVADGDSDQVVVNTLADLFDVKKALSLGTSAQLVGSMTEEALRHLAEKRYSSRFGAFVQEPNPADAVSTRLPSAGENRKGRGSFPSSKDHDEQSPRPRARHNPSSNEVRKRYTRDETGQGTCQ
ncbi:OPT oligopeptide transporter [Penicillium atrosanguineum]|uniref:OPT oligopeptide transporter n=1 Tax=Penicillium atrosanguineum TaxID=1132637 RepID=UPI0023950696|nr:OPT oligopeptide transporter [Penicillium atrosanguineum]KAJ5313973.1 OPT oligopeptide transporter [Penicillium atrosanguineum]